MGPNLPLFFFSFFLHRLTWTWHLEEWKDGFKIYVSRFRADWCTWDGDGEEFSVDAGRVARWCPCMRERTVTPLKPRRTNPTGRPPSLTCSGGAAPAGGLAAGATLKAPFWGMRHIHWATLSCCLRASFSPTLPKHESKRLTRLKEVYCELLYFWGWALPTNVASWINFPSDDDGWAPVSVRTLRPEPGGQPVHHPQHRGDTGI